MKSKRHTVAELLAAAFDQADELPPFFEQVTDAVYRLESRRVVAPRAHNRSARRRQTAQSRRVPRRAERRKPTA